MLSHAGLPAITRALGLDLSESQLAALAAYRDRLAGAELNLVSARDRDQIESRHLAESLAYGRLLQRQGLLPDGVRLLDLGAGGGLPGKPIRIACPAVRLTLLESVGKKCRFLEQVAQDLDLAGVVVLEGRAETFGRNEAHREQYDLVVARAVAPLPVLLEYALPFLRTGGHLAAVKGTAALDEIEAAEGALQALGGHLVDAPAFEPPQGPRQTVVIVRKDTPTPQRYPRREGIPAKRPLA